MVPREHPTGGQQKLLGISKRGNSYLRRLFVQGARAVLQQRYPCPQAEARRLPQSGRGNETRGERRPRKCFGTEVQSIGYQRELGLAVSRAGRSGEERRIDLLGKVLGV